MATPRNPSPSTRPAADLRGVLPHPARERDRIEPAQSTPPSPRSRRGRDGRRRRARAWPRASPDAARERTPRMSAVPARPTSPESCSSPSATSGCGQAAARSGTTETRPGSTLPDRVAMARPSSGVKPIVVSTERPLATAASDAPAPRWHVTIRRPSIALAEQLRSTAGRLGMRQAMEPVSPQRPALPPLAGDRVRGGGGRQRGVERRVEAGDVRNTRQRVSDGLERVERPWLVERRERRQGLEAGPGPRRRRRVAAE